MFTARKRPINRAVTLRRYDSCARGWAVRGSRQVTKPNGGIENMRKVFATVLVGLLLNPGMLGAAPPPRAKSVKTATPIKHLVVIFQENVSFDHYFGTYPNALNPGGEPRFFAAPGTPSINGLTGTLLTQNPNASNPTNALTTG